MCVIKRIKEMYMQEFMSLYEHTVLHWNPGKYLQNVGDCFKVSNSVEIVPRSYNHHDVLL